MLDVAKVVKRRISEYAETQHVNEYASIDDDYEAYINDDNIVAFIKQLLKVPARELKNVKRDIISAVSSLNEDATSDARDFILSGQSALGPDVQFSAVEQTIDELIEHHNENYREVMMLFYSDYYKILQENYHFRDWQFTVGVTYDDVPYMDFLIPEKVLDVLIADMKRHGMQSRHLPEIIDEFKDKMFKREFPDGIDISDKFEGWTYVRFTPIKQRDCRKVIRNNSRYIYHITDVTNVNAILKDGLKMNNLSHPEVQPRIFLIVPNRQDLPVDPRDDNFDFNYYITRALPGRLYSYRIKDGTAKDNGRWDFAVVRIDVDKIPADVEFYWDIHSFPFAFFTEDAIPASAIVDYETNTYTPW